MILLKKIKLEVDRYDEIKQEVGNAEELLEALRAAQPIINAIGRYMYQLMDRADVKVDELVNKLDAKIDEEFAEVIHYQESLETEKYNILRSLALLYKSYKGDMEAYALLDKTESIHRKDLIADPPPSDDDLAGIAKYLQNRLSALHVVENEIKSDWETYRTTHRELDSLHEKAKHNIQKVRVLMLVWLRAHQKMASGVVAPAEWFNLKSMPGDFLKMGIKVAT